MLYSASRRSDMVAFHPDAIVDKVRRSRKLDGIVFWTKDPRNLAGHHELSHVALTVPSVVQLTVTGLGNTAWEPGVPPFESILPALRELASRLPHGAIRWRFDPIIPLPDLFDRFRLIKTRLAEALGGVEEVVVSFPDPYKKAVERVCASGLAWPRASLAEQRDTLAFMVNEFTGQGGDGCPVKLCCEPKLLDLPGVGQARCVDDALFRRLYGLELGELAKDPGQRQACGCVKSTDIGSYDLACPHRCRYCYANPMD